MLFFPKSKNDRDLLSSFTFVFSYVSQNKQLVDTTSPSQKSTLFFDDSPTSYPNTIYRNLFRVYSEYLFRETKNKMARHSALQNIKNTYNLIQSCFKMKLFARQVKRTNEDNQRRHA